MLATVVDTDALWQTIVYALVAAVGVTITFSIAIQGAVRAGDSSRDGHTLAAAAWSSLAIVAVVASLAAIVIGVIVVSSK